MKIKKLYAYKSKQHVWRILLTDSNQFLIETRDVNSKEVFFNCIDIKTGKPIFSDFQFEEKYWMGIETIYKDVIIFHKYAKPDMPGHKEIICFDIASQKVLWSNDTLIYLFIYNDQVLAASESFTGHTYYALDYRSGQVSATYGDNSALINQLKIKAEEEKDYSAYKFPEKISKETLLQIEDETQVKEIIKNLDIIGDVEYTSYENLLLMNYFFRAGGRKLQNKFTAIDLAANKVVFENVLMEDAKGFAPDSFFVYNNILILLKERDQVIVCGIE